MSNEFDYDNNSYEEIDNELPYIDSFEQYAIASDIVRNLRDYIMSHGLDMLTSNNAVDGMVILL